MTTHTDKKEESVSEKLVHRDVEALEQNKQEIADIKNIVSPSKNETPEAPLQEGGVEDWEKRLKTSLYNLSVDRSGDGITAYYRFGKIGAFDYLRDFFAQELATQKEQTVRATREEVLRDLFKTRIIPKKVEDQEASFLIQLTVKQTIKKYAQKVGISLDTQE